MAVIDVIFRLNPAIYTTDLSVIATIESYIADSELVVKRSLFCNPDKAVALWTLYTMELLGVNNSLASNVGQSTSGSGVSSLKRVKSNEHEIEYDNAQVSSMVSSGKYEHPENKYGILFDQEPRKRKKRQTPFLARC